MTDSELLGVYRASETQFTGILESAKLEITAQIVEGGPKGEKGEPGVAGQDGLTTSVKVGTTQYNHVNGTISLPAYPASLPADGGNAATVNDKTVLSDVPLNAKFTDTITTINGKTDVISKNDIVALGILAQGTELRLGNFKFVFNEVENSLDLEVLA